MNLLYPAASGESLEVICEKLAVAFEMPAFCVVRDSEYIRNAHSASGPFEIEVIEFLGRISEEEAAKIGPPDHWNLAWRIAVGLEFNFQIKITRGAVTRRQRERTAHKLRSIFSQVRLHGE